MRTSNLTDEDIEIIAERIADILERRRTEKREAEAALMVEALLNTPIKTIADYEKE